MQAHFVTLLVLMSPARSFHLEVQMSPYLLRCMSFSLFLGLLGGSARQVWCAGDASVQALIEQVKTGDDASRLKAIVALGEKGQSAEAALPVLLDLLMGPNSNGKLHPDVFRAVERIGFDKSDVPDLLKELRKAESNPFIASKLLAIAGELAMAPLVGLLDDPTPEVRRRALLAFAQNRGLSASVVPHFVKCLNDSDPLVCIQAAGTLGLMGAEARDAIPALIKALENNNQGAAGAFRRLGPLAKDAVPALRAALKDRATVRTVNILDPSDIGKSTIRTLHLAEEAALALGAIGPEAASAVEDLLTATKDSRPGVRLAAVQALGQIRAVAAIPKLLAIFDESSPSKDDVGKAAAKALGDIGQPAVPVLLKAREGKTYSMRLGAAFALGYVRPVHENAIATLRPYLIYGTPAVRLTVVEIFRGMGADGKNAVPGLVAALAVPEQTEDVRRKIAEALAEIGEPAGPAIVKSTKDKNAATRRWAAVVLGKMKSPPPEAIATLATLLEKDSDAKVRVAAAHALGEFGPDAKSALPVLQQRADTDANGEVRNAAGVALKKLRE